MHPFGDAFSLTSSEKSGYMPVGSDAPGRDLLHGFVDGVEPPFGFVGASHCLFLVLMLVVVVLFGFSE